MFTLSDLPYDYNSLEPYLDQETMHLHHDKHHAAYVKNLNDALFGHDDLLALPVEELLVDLTQIPEDIRQKVQNNGGGHFNHTLFWSIMGPDAGSEPEGALSEAINQSFTDFETFKQQFTAKAVGRFGSGWAWLVLKDHKLQLMDTANQDTPLSEGAIPLLGLDVWEHAYYLKYQNRRVEYIENWWNVVNWPEVAKRFERR